MIKTTNAATKVAAAAAGFAMALSMVAAAPYAHAASLTSSQVQAIISLLQSFGADASTIANVQASLTGGTPTSGGSTSGGTSASCSFSRDLTTGASGADVTCLQQALIGAGFSIPAGATGYFGSQTTAAVSAWQKANGVAPSAGYFGSISRSHWNLGGGSSGSGTGTVPIGSGNGLKVMLSPTSPNGTALVQGQGIGDVADYVFSNPTASAISVTGVTFNRIGVSNDSTISNVYLYQGVNRITDAAGVSNSQFTFSSPTGIFTVPAGSSVTVSVREDIAAATAGQTIGAALVSVSSTGTLDSTVAFPINSGIQAIASATLATVDFSSSANTIPTGTPTISPQSAYTLWQNTVSVSSNPVKLSSLKLTNLGSADASAITNLRLYVDGTQVGNTAPSLSGDRTVTFDLSAAPVMLSTQSHVIKVLGDVVGGASRTFQFSLQRSSDAMLIDNQLGQPVTPTVAGASFSAITAGTVTVQSTGNGGVSVTKDPASPINDVAVGASNVKLASFDFLASGEPTKVMDLSVCADTSVHNGGLDNGKIFLNGVQVGSTKDITECGTNTDFSLGSSLILPAGQTAKIDVYADARTSTSTNLNSGETAIVKLEAGTSNGQGQYSLTSTNVPTSEVTGNTINVTSSTLTAAKATGYANQTMIAGSQNAKLGSFTLAAGSTEDVNVNTITIAASSSMASEITNLTLKDDATGATLGTIIPTPSTSNSYSVSLTIPMSSTKTISVYGNILASGSTSILLGLPTSGVTGTGVTTGTSATASPVMLQTITVGSGTLSGGVSASNPVASNVIMGSQQLQVGSFTFSAQNSPFTVQKLEVDVPNASAAAINGLSIQYKDQNGATQTVSQALQAGASTSTAQFSGLSFYVPMNDSSDVSVWVSTPIIASGGSAISGVKIVAALPHATNFQAVDASGSATTTPYSWTSDANSNATTGYGTLVVRKSIPTFAMQTISGYTQPTSGNPVYRFSVTADPAGAVDLDQLSFSVSTSTVTAKDYKLYDITSGTAVALNAAAVNADSSGVVKVVLDTLQQVGAGNTKTYELRPATVSGWASGASITVSLAQDTSYIANAAAGSLTSGNNIVWSDRSANNHASQGTSATDWTNGYLLKDFVNDTTSVTYHS